VLLPLMEEERGERRTASSFLAYGKNSLAEGG